MSAWRRGRYNDKSTYEISHCSTFVLQSLAKLSVQTGACSKVPRHEANWEVIELELIRLVYDMFLDGIHM
jgi:hypothetical protein